MSEGELSIDELLAIMEQPVPPPASSAPFRTFERWVQEMGVIPGRAVSAPTVELHSHFREWSGADVGTTQFGHWLHRSGLVKGRKVIKGHDTRPWLMGENAARTFRQWVMDNREKIK